MPTWLSGWFQWLVSRTTWNGIRFHSIHVSIASRFHIQDSRCCDGSHFSRSRRLHAGGNIQCADGAKRRGRCRCLEFVGSKFIGHSHVLGHSVAHSEYFAPKRYGSRIYTNQFLRHRILDIVTAFGCNCAVCRVDAIAVPTQTNGRCYASDCLFSNHYVRCFIGTKCFLSIHYLPVTVMNFILNMILIYSGILRTDSNMLISQQISN